MNFGVSATTLLNSGDKPYQKEGAFQSALGSHPNVVVIMLGSNDTKPQNWKKDRFAADYKDLVAKFKALPEHPRIFICEPVPVVAPGNFGISEPVLREELPLIEQVAKEENVGLIDLHASLAPTVALLPDHVHPNTAGAALMAKSIYRVLTGRDFAGDVARRDGR